MRCADWAVVSNVVDIASTVNKCTNNSQLNSLSEHIGTMHYAPFAQYMITGQAHKFSLEFPTKSTLDAIRVIFDAIVLHLLRLRDDRFVLLGRDCNIAPPINPQSCRLCATGPDVGVRITNGRDAEEKR